MRFGLDNGPLELNGREAALIENALNQMRLYCLRLAARNRDEEARGRNITNALELQVLINKVKEASK